MENDNETCVQGERMETRLVFRIQLNEGGGGGLATYTWWWVRSFTLIIFQTLSDLQCVNVFGKLILTSISSMPKLSFVFCIWISAIPQSIYVIVLFVSFASFVDDFCYFISWILITYRFNPSIWLHCSQLLNLNLNCNWVLVKIQIYVNEWRINWKCLV